MKIHCFLSSVQVSTIRKHQKSFNINFTYECLWKLFHFCSKNKKYDEAIAVFRECEKSATFTDLCQFGLLLYCAGKLTDSYRGKSGCALYSFSNI